jgi:hypothetical protein
MYFNKGKPMQYKEEGAAFFPPAAPPADFPMRGIGMLPPRTMGIDMSLLTNGFVAGVGADDATTAEEPSVFSTPAPILAAAVGFLGGFILWRLK